MIRSILTLLVVNITLMSHGQETKTLEKDAISFEYPINWLVRDFPGYYILVSEPPKEQMSVMTTFDVAIDETFKTVKKFCLDYEEKMTNNSDFKDFKIKSKDEIDFKGYEAIEYHCTATVQYLPIEWRAIVFMKNGKIYKLSTTSMIGQFYLLSEKTNKIFESFEIK